MRIKQYHILAPAVVGVAAFVIRLINALSAGSDYYANMLSDASTYRVWASKILQGVTYGEPVFQMGPLYPYFLALNLKIGLGFDSILILQAILGAGAAVMIYLTTKQVYDRKAGVISGLLAAFYAPFVFYDGLLLSESLQVFLISASLFLLTKRADKARIGATALAGILVGLAALGRATILFFATALCLLWLISFLLSRRPKNRTYYLVRICSLALGVIIGIMPAALHNIANGDFVLISSNTGINFYIGNNRDSNGTYEEPKGLDLFTDFHGRKIAEMRSGRALKSSEVSSFWIRQTLRDLKSQPDKFVSGFLNKIWLYLWHFDIPQAEAIHIQHIFSPVFKMPLLGFAVIFTFGMLGILFARGNEARWIPVILFVTNILGVALFFVVGRFKLLGALGLIVPAGAGVAAIYQYLSGRNWIRLLLATAVSIICILILILPRPLDRENKAALVYDNVGIYYYFKNDYKSAMEWYRKAADVSGGNSESMNNIGTVFYAQNNIDSANFYFHKSLERDSTSDKTLLNLGRIAMVRGQLDSARHYYVWAKRVAPFGTSADKALEELARKARAELAGPAQSQSFETLYEMAQGLAAQGKYDQASGYYQAALRLRPDNITALNNLGFAFQAQKKFPQAAAIFERVRQLSPNNAVAYNNLAGTLYQMGRLDSAIVLWERAIRIDPSNLQFKTNLEFARKSRK